MPGSGSAFIPTINAITTSQDLQWMVQPTVITSMSSPYSRSHPYSHPLPPLSSVAGHTALQRPGVIKTIGTTVGRRRRDEQVTVVGRAAGSASNRRTGIPPPCPLSGSPRAAGHCCKVLGLLRAMQGVRWRAFFLLLPHRTARLTQSPSHASHHRAALRLGFKSR